MTTLRKKIVASAVSFATVASLAGAAVMPVKAQTTAELQAQIAALLAQIQQLQSQLSGTTGGTTTGSSYTYTRDLTTGSKGDDVTALQDFLVAQNKGTAAQALANVFAAGTAKGYFGSMTQAALAEYQAAVGISPASGYFGPITRAHMASLTPTTPTDPTTPTNPVAVDGLKVEVASTSPAATTLVESQAVADVAHFTFTNGDDTAVTVTQLMLTKLGISSSTAMESLYLFSGSQRLTDAATFVSTTNKATFSNPSGLFTVPANSSMTVAVKADINSSTAGQSVGVQIAAATDVASNASEVSGTYPVSGAVHSIASSGSSLATADFASSTIPSSASINPGTDVVMWQKNLSISNRTVDLSRLAFRKRGSVDDSDVQNFRLYIDGTLVDSTASVDSTGYVVFAPSTAYAMTTGTHVVKVIGDVVGGSSFNVYLQLKEVADIELVDSSFDVAIRPTVASATFSAQSGGTLSINSGSVTATKADDSPTGNIIDNATDATIGKFTLTAYGERVKVESLKAGFVASGTSVTGLTNGRVLVDGVQVGNTATMFAAGTTYTGTFYVEPGTPVTVEFRADIEASAGTITAGLTGIQAKLYNVTGNGEGMSSSTAINVPTADKTASTVTVQTGGMNLAEYVAYADPTIVVPQDAQKLAEWTLLNSGYETVLLDTITVDFTAGGAFDGSDDLNNVYVVYGDNTSSIKSTVSDTGNVYSVSYELGSNDGISVAVYGDVASTATSGTLTPRVLVSGTTVQSGTAVSTNSGTVLDGQTVTSGSGSFTATADASTPDEDFAAAGSTEVPVASYKFEAVNDDYVLETVRVAFTGTGAASVVQYAMLKMDGTMIAMVPLQSGTATFDISVPVTANDEVVLDLEVNLGTVGTYAGTTGADIKATMNLIQYDNSAGTRTTNVESDAGNSIYVFKAFPTITNETLPSSALVVGTQTLAIHEVAATGGTVGVGKIVYTVSESANPYISTGTIKVYKDGVEVSGTVATATTSGGSLEAASAGTGTITFTPTSEMQISGTSTIELRADILGAIVEGDYITTKIAETGSQQAAAAFGSVGSSSFTWSDRSGVPHNTSSSTDWYNDYFLTPTAAQTMSQ